jgi:hypothetical protein
VGKWRWRGMWRRRRRRRATKAAAGALVTSTSGGGCTMRDRYIEGGGDEHGANSELVFTECSEFLCPDIKSGHKFYVGDFRTKHKL